jgi:hypothetical protein
MGGRLPADGGKAVPAWQGTDELEDLPSRGQHVGHAVGFSEMLLDQLDLFRILAIGRHGPSCR